MHLKKVGGEKDKKKKDESTNSKEPKVESEKQVTKKPEAV
jgi:hypothetical protein